ncbi:hypothetical protein [Kitasatospora sp. NPDC088134]
MTEPARATESVWHYPRPPALVPDGRLVEVRFAGRLLGSGNGGPGTSGW